MCHWRFLHTWIFNAGLASGVQRWAKSTYAKLGIKEKSGDEDEAIISLKVLLVEVEGATGIVNQGEKGKIHSDASRWTSANRRALSASLCLTVVFNCCIRNINCSTSPALIIGCDCSIGRLENLDVKEQRKNKPIRRLWRFHIPDCENERTESMSMGENQRRLHQRRQRPFLISHQHLDYQGTIDKGKEGSKQWSRQQSQSMVDEREVDWQHREQRYDEALIPLHHSTMIDHRPIEWILENADRAGNDIHDELMPQIE